MTYEQFVYWVSGYITGHDQFSPNSGKLDMISEALRTVKNYSEDSVLVFDSCS